MGYKHGLMPMLSRDVRAAIPACCGNQNENTFGVVSMIIVIMLVARGEEDCRSKRGLN